MDLRYLAAKTGILDPQFFPLDMLGRQIELPD